MTVDRVAALRQEREELLAFCRDLSDEQWRAPSAAAGWRVLDVVAHMGSGFSPGVLKFMRSKDIEHTNDLLVDQRRAWPPARTLTEYERGSRRAIAMMGFVSRTPMQNLSMPLAELGRFRLALIASAMVFDHHTHLRHDIAPAVGRPAPGTDANRIAVALEWMMAVLGNQLRKDPPGWLDRPLSITLSGPGGSCWVVCPGGSVRLAGAEGTAAQINSPAVQFPEWGTKRVDWRDRDVKISGDADYAGRFLDAVNVV